MAGRSDRRDEEGLENGDLPRIKLPSIRLPGQNPTMTKEEHLKARLYSYAPMVAAVNPRALKFKGVTKCQARKLAERPNKMVEPLPALRRYQEEHQADFIQRKERERQRARTRKLTEAQENQAKLSRDLDKDSLESVVDGVLLEDSDDEFNREPTELEKFHQENFPRLQPANMLPEKEEVLKEGRGRTRIGRIHASMECIREDPNKYVILASALVGMTDLDEIVRIVMANKRTIPCVYLTPAVSKDCVEYHYYNLICVEYKDVLVSDYVTISHVSAIRTREDTRIENMSIQQWCSEVEIFRKLNKLATFRLHRKWKTFNVWLKNMRSLRTNICKKKLNENLFILSDTLRPAIFDVMELCLETKQLDLFVIDEKKSHTLEEFNTSVLESLNLMTRELNLFRHLISDIVYSACKTTLLEAGFIPDHDSSGSENARGQSEPAIHFQEATNAQAMLGEEQLPMVYTLQAQKRHICKRLTNFVIMMDYIVLNTMQYLVTRGVESLNKHLCSQLSLAGEVDEITAANPADNEEILPQMDLTMKDVEETEEEKEAREKEEADMKKRGIKAKPKQRQSITGDAKSSHVLVKQKEPAYHPMITTCLVLSPEEIVFSPSLNEIKASMAELLDHWQTTVRAIENMTPDTMFDAVTSPYINNKLEEKTCGDGPCLKNVLKNCEMFQESLNAVLVNVDHSFQMVHLYAETLEKHRMFYSEDVEFDINKWRKPGPINISDPDYIIKTLHTLHQQYRMATNIPDTYPVGGFLVDAKEFKNILSPAPIECLKAIHSLLPDLVRKDADTVLEILADAKKKLEEKPTTTNGFVTMLRFLDDFQVHVESLEIQAVYIKEVYNLMNEFQIATRPEDKLLVDSLEPTIYNAKNCIDRALSVREQTIEKFNKCADKDIGIYFGEVKDVVQKMQEPLLLDDKADEGEVREVLDQLLEKMHEIQVKAKILKDQQKELKVEVTRFDYLDDSMFELKLRDTLWSSIEEWRKTVDVWYEVAFETLDPEEVTMTTLKFAKTVQTLEKGLPPNDVVIKLKDKVEQMKSKLGVITNMRNPHLKKRHWDLIEQILNYKFDTKKEILNLQLLIDIKAFNKADEMQDIAGMASSQAALEAILKKVVDNWRSVEFQVMHFKDNKDVFVLGNTDDIQQLLDDSSINLQTILSSRNVGPIKATVDEWSNNVSLFNKILEAWNTCQRNWMYLESIFSAPDIQKQLPAEAKMFTEVDRSYKEIMRRVHKAPAAMRNGTQAGLLDVFNHNNKLLDEIMKCLEAYLESKRVVFPRFYFLSNDELLEILAQTRNPLAVQPHLRKCFDAIHRLEFGLLEAVPGEEVKHSNDILAMLSPEGERIDLGKGLKARGNVEDWLSKVEEAMFGSLRKLCKKCIKEYDPKNVVPWILENASQVVLTISQMMWTRDVTKILQNSRTAHKAMKEFEKKCIIALTLLATTVRGHLSKLERATMCALITIDVHARDMITDMVKKVVHEVNSFEWQKQLRYYWDMEIDNCIVCMSIAVYKYGYEYLGACPRLVITPLTDRCYLCLMGALQLDLGGAPAGPAGTGKTETTKDLAKAVAIQCVVFNCSDQLDYTMMAGFFSGLAQSGAWCCFDEFNRINIEVLSVIAQQLITIRNAKAAKLSRFMFEGREIKLIQTCAAFITMNPGYAGRTELPDNLQALFRPISMMVPDYGLIAEVILYSEGFESSKLLAKKMVQMYKLCSEQLSQQDHYDFGMRAVKSVLVMAGSLKRQSPDKSEDVVLIRALRDSNLPKFLTNDAFLFQAILGDLFPGVVIPEHDYGKVKEEIITVQKSLNLQVVESQIVKVIQFYETMIVRHGVMLVGPTGGGKTTIYEILDKTITNLHSQGLKNEWFEPVHTHVMNPKSVSMDELYGGVDKQSMEWKDGLMGLAIRHCVQDQSADHHWVICDGPVDALWIENMNTVLDDNKMLCLANSERIKLTPYIHMVFEVQDLAVASPATVSRCGMVYVDPDDLKWMPYVKTWMHGLLDKYKLGEGLSNYLMDLFEQYIEDGLQFVYKKCAQAINQVEICKVTTVCKLLEAIIFNPHNPINFATDPQKINRIVTQTFAFAYLWGVGGNLLEAYWDGFDTFVRQQFDENPDAKLPASAVLWSYYVDTENKKMDTWDRLVMPFRFDKSVSFFKMLVPTPDTTRFGYLLDVLLAVNHGILFTGDTGVGKSVIAKDLLDRMSDRYNYVPVFINFSAQTSSIRTQEMIEGKLEKRRKNVIGAPRGKRVIFFIDDLNMPKLDTYGSQAPIELLRQYLDYGGLYDRETMQWKQIEDVTLCAACSPPGGGRNIVSPRLFRHFSMMCIPAPSESTLKGMFLAILNGFFLEFPRNIRTLAEPLVNSAVEIYFKMSTDLLPTPAKSHYVFNLRDLSKVVQGILQADSGTMREKMIILKLFIHETQRVFHDRLISKEDKMFFHNIMAEVVGRFFGESLEPQSFVKKPILFGNFMKLGVADEDKIYEEITRMDKLESVLGDYLDDFNMGSSKEMHLVFFLDAIEHITRLVRIIQQERGNALLVGIGGTGKQSLTRLSAHICGYKCFQIELCRGYDYAAFHDDLKKLYECAGGQNQPTVFLFTDTQIVMEEFLEDINNMLNSGEVPNLLEAEDVEKLINACRPAAKQAGIAEGNRDGIYDYCISQVRNNLHIVLCMSPVGSAFRSRCRMFPSLVNCCTIDWFIEWPSDALLGVARQYFKPVDLGCSDAVKDNVASMCVEIHISVSDMAEKFYNELKRRYYTTPTSYLELISLYLGMINDQTKSIKNARERVQNGLRKLFETNKVVDSMKKELVALEPELKQKSADTMALMERLKIDQAAADEVKVAVQADEAVAKKKADETQAIADDAQKDLNEALPALESALKSLDALDKNDIAEIRVFSKPPELVQTVMEAVAILLGHKTDWASCKNMLGDNKFLSSLRDYDKDNIPPAKIAKIKKYINNPNFVPHIVEKTSKACKCMVIWVRAMDLYASVFKLVEPKRMKLAEAKGELDKVMALLLEKQNMLKGVEKQIKNLQGIFDKSVSEKKALERTMNVTASRLKRASKLTSALAEEGVRWEESIASFNTQLGNVVGDVFIAAACVAYYGAFTAHYRAMLMSDWVTRLEELQIPVTEGMTLVSVLADAYEIRMWNENGLPRDNVSTENAILVTRGRRWPLMIDPQEQANRWIRNMEKENNLKVCKMTDSNFLRILEACIRTGFPVLMEDVGEVLDPALEPILLKQTFISGGRLLIHLGDSDIDYDKNFRFYMTSKLSNPHYLPEVCIKVTIINFTVTKKGLEDQILSDVVSLERPDLEEQRNTLITKINADQAELKKIENKILKMLFESEGNILDNEELINILNESKVTSQVIKQRLGESEVTEERITSAREKYRSVAERGSVMYFVVSDMGEVDPMYQFSLKYFKQLFNKTIETSEKAEELSERLEILLRETTICVYQNVARGLFERHKLVFSFMLCTHILKTAGEIKMTEWNFFLRGPAGGTDKVTEPKPEVLKWMPLHTWKLAVELEKCFPAFRGILNDLQTTSVFVKLGNLEIHATPKPAQFPEGSTCMWNDNLNNFEKMLFIKIFKEEKTTFAVTEFVSVMLGQEFVESPPVTLADLYDSMTKFTPLVFVLSTGSDPMGNFLRFAKERNILDRVQSISLGQGQGPLAEKMVSSAIKSGDWVFLQNCHLAASWMLKMESIIKDLQEHHYKIDEEFRLYLSSMPAKHFPVSVLQNSVKVTNEPPKGIRANLRRAFTEMTNDYFEKKSPVGPENWRKMIFGLCFFHAVILERKKFGPLGWNIKYPFSDSDRECALLNLDMFCSDKKIPWETLIYITGEITYGGRVTDAQDQRCIRTILKIFFKHETLDPRYKYSESGIYHPPNHKHISSVIKYIEGLPIIDEPEIFGLHENANIAFQMAESESLLGTILEVEPRVATGEGALSNDEIVYMAADDILERVVEKLDIEDALQSMFVPDYKGRQNSLTVVLIQEVDRFNKLLARIKKSLEQLKRAIKGFVVMSDELELMFHAFINNKVPAMWESVAYPSLKCLASWVKDLILRCQFVRNWIIYGPPKSFWISGFFFPQGFLTGTLQNYARRHNKPIDFLTFKFEVLNVDREQDEVTAQMATLKRGETIPLDDLLPDLEDGVLVHGLFMEGFAWDWEKMQCGNSVRGQMHCRLPVMQMDPMMDYVPEGNLYSAPLYKTGARAGTLSTTGHSTNYVVAVQLPSAVAQDYWIARGAALLCQLSD